MKTLPLVVFLLCSGLLNAQPLNLMPVPASVVFHNTTYRIRPDFSIGISGPESPRIYAETSRFKKRLAERTGLFFKTWQVSASDSNSQRVSLTIRFELAARVESGMDESYTLEINNKGLIIQSKTDIGILRGLETLFQLINQDSSGYFLPGISISDQPRFSWRGLLLSQPYHFMPMDVIKRILDGMAAVKMNVFHFYVSDDQGFTIESRKYPRLHQLASGGQFFTQEQVKEIIQYADQRGIRVVPEVDLPGHCTAILVAYPHLAAIKRNYVLQDHWGVFDPSVDPTREEVYGFLDTLLSEVANLFPDRYFHIGGDENTGKDWSNNDSIQRFMKANGFRTTLELQNHFNRRIQQILKKSGKSVIGWDEVLMKELPANTAKQYFEEGSYDKLILTDVPKDMIIQSWRGMEALLAAAKNGYQCILSKGYYIDLVQSTEYHYLNDPVPFRNTRIVPDSEANLDRFESQIIQKIQKGEKLLSEEEEKLIIGGEATMWTEHVTEETVESRIWPRTAAIAERLWSPANIRDVKDMYRRLDHISLVLESLGSGHQKNREMMMRRLAQRSEIDELMKVVNLLEPVKGYQRNQLNNFTKYSPYTGIVDIAIPDPAAIRIFQDKIERYQKNPSVAHRKELENEFTNWVRWSSVIEKMARYTPSLNVIKHHSLSLAGLAGIGLDIIKPGFKATSEWKTKAMAYVKKSKVPYGYCELGVARIMDSLINK